MVLRLPIVRVLFCIIAFFLLVFRVEAQPRAEWMHTYNKADYNYIFALSTAEHGGFLFGGTTIDKDEGDYSLWLTRIDSTGQPLWDTLIGPGEENTLFNTIARTGHGFVVGGTIDVDSVFDGYHSDDDQPVDGAIVSIDDSGHIAWSHCYGGTRNDEIRKIIATHDGGFVFVGTTNSTDGDIHDYQGNPDSNAADVGVEKIDSAGNVLWEKTFGGSGLDLGADIAELTDHTIAVVANTNSTDGEITNPLGGYDIWVIRLDSNGNMLWQKSFGTSGSDGATGGVVASTDGTMLVSGYMSYLDAGTPTSSLWAAKLAPDGSVMWQTNPEFWAGYSVMAMTEVPSAIPGTASQLMLAAHAQDQNHVTQNWIFALDSNGHLVSTGRFTEGSYNGVTFQIPSINAIVADANGEFAFTYSLSSDTGQTGVVATFSTSDLAVKITAPANSNTLDLFPVPASNMLHVQLESGTGPEIIRMYNTIGSCVLTDTKHSNSTNISLDVSSLPRGVYYLEVEANGASSTRAVVLE